MAQSHRLLITLAVGSLVLGGCSSQHRIQPASTFPPVEAGQRYQLKTASGLLASGAVVEETNDWLKLDIGDTRPAGAARILWVRKNNIEWLGKAQAQSPIDTQRVRRLHEKQVKLENDLDYSLNTMQRTEAHPAVIKLRKAIEKVRQQQEDAAGGR